MKPGTLVRITDKRMKESLNVRDYIDLHGRLHIVLGPASDYNHDRGYDYDGGYMSLRALATGHEANWLSTSIEVPEEPNDG